MKLKVDFKCRLFTSRYRIDIAVLLGKTPPSSSETENPPMEAAQPPSLSQSLVFSNSKQGVPLSQTSPSTPYTQHSMVRLTREALFCCRVSTAAGLNNSLHQTVYIQNGVKVVDCVFLAIPNKCFFFFS